MNAISLMLVLLGADVGENSEVTVTVASKAFTESAIVSEIITQLGQHATFRVKHKEQLGGTGLVWKSLTTGVVDVYPDYTGTIAKDILKDESLRDEGEIRAALAEQGVNMSRSLGFENSFEIGMQEEVAERLGIHTISDLKQHPDLHFGFGTEFMDREDGWPGLRRRYGLPQTKITGMEHTISYRALQRGGIDGMDIYATDANVHQFGIRILEDDLDYFPKYDAVIVYRADLAERAPAFEAAMRRLEGAITRDTMLAMNVKVDIDKQTPRSVANEFLANEFSLDVAIYEPNLFQRIAGYTLSHLLLVVVSLTAAIVVAVPLGVLAAKRPATQHAILSTTEIIQTIPGLALLVLLMTPLGLIGQTVGPVPAIIALFLYSLLPVIRNTYAGICDIPNSIRESATALGLTPWAQLVQVELPMASRMIVTGIKTTAVINVGYATLGGLIGAGGYGQPILQGLYRTDVPKMLEGAIPAAVLALAVKWVFEISERYVVPKGLRI